MLVAVDGILTCDDKIVLIRRKSKTYHNRWAFPGGMIERDESAEEALVREMKEETNAYVTIQDILGVYSGPTRDPRGNSLTVVFICKFSGKLQAADDAKEVVLLPLEAAKEKDLAFDHGKILLDFIKWKEAPKKITYYSNYPKFSINRD